MIYRLGPRAIPIYTLIRDNIASGQWPTGMQLPPHPTLAKEFRVAELTIRAVLSQLESDRLISREQGRGTFVRGGSAPNVMVVDDDPVSRTVLRELVKRSGDSPVEAARPSHALDLLEQEHSIALVLTDIRMPRAADGTRFIRTLYRRWPRLVVGAVTGYPNDLSGLLGTRECPVVILSKPVDANRLELVLRLGLGRAVAAS